MKMWRRMIFPIHLNYDSIKRAYERHADIPSLYYATIGLNKHPFARTFLAPPWGGGGGDSPGPHGQGLGMGGVVGQGICRADVCAPHECLSPHNPPRRVSEDFCGGFLRGSYRLVPSEIRGQARLRPQGACGITGHDRRSVPPGYLGGWRGM